jgi:hypothetical protein
MWKGNAQDLKPISADRKFMAQALKDAKPGRAD